jgi:predicted 2-oxoglutarate/Fe(II)-dependent dioxygenase YbiX
MIIFVVAIGLTVVLSSTGWASNTARTTSAAAEFRLNNRFAYIRNVLSPNQFAIVQQNVRAAKRGKSWKLEKGSYAQGRKGTQLSRSDPICDVFSSTAVIDRIKKASGRSGSLSIPLELFPMEIREYTIGSSMDWHVDDCLFKEPQLELVYTSENESDSETKWKDARGQTRSVFTEANSLIIIEAGAAEHAVTPLKRGKRTILKALVVGENREILDPVFFQKAKGTFRKE